MPFVRYFLPTASALFFCACDPSGQPDENPDKKTTASVAQPTQDLAPPKPTTATDPPRPNTRVPPEVQVYGSVHEIMMMGETQSRVRVADASSSPTTYGLGAIEGLRGEVTIVAGESSLAYPDGTDKVRIDTSKSPDEEASLLVTTQVETWTAISIQNDVQFPELGAHVAKSAGDLGWDAKGAMPFLIEGPVSGLAWHVIDGTRIPHGAQGHAAHKDAAVRGQIDTQSATLIGFYSTEHQGVFTHRDSTVHVHFVDKEHQLSGHLDAVIVKKGATLKLPRT